MLPTHGFGSFCSAGSTGDTTASTIGAEKRQNPALTQNEERWVADTLAGLDAYPAYYAHMAPANSAGPGAPDLATPETADKDTLAARIAAGEWVVDLRTRTAFADGHVTGTLNFGVDGQFATYLGWLIPWGTPLTPVGDTAEQVAEAQRELVRIGIDHLAGAATGTPEQWTDNTVGTFERAVFADLAQVRHHRPVSVLDVRRASEFDDGHIDGAVNIPLHELLARVGDVPAGEVWVHCAGGYRASIATSVLAARGIPVVAVDDTFGENAASTSLLVIAVNSATALTARITTGGTHLDWPLIAGFTAAAIIGSLFGGRITSRVKPARLTRAFAVLLVAVALYTAARSIPALF